MVRNTGIGHLYALHAMRPNNSKLFYVVLIENQSHQMNLQRNVADKVTSGQVSFLLIPILSTLLVHYNFIVSFFND